jgi:hypothetical protein
MSGQVWEVTVPAALRWRITKASGELVSDVTFPSAGMMTLYLSYSVAMGWQLSLLSPRQLSQDLAQMNCPAGQEMLAGEAQNSTKQDYWGVTILQDHGLQGCLLDLQLNEADQGHFVWRFGALLAADAKAHLTLPQLPMASPAELAAVAG